LVLILAIIALSKWISIKNRHIHQLITELVAESQGQQVQPGQQSEATASQTPEQDPPSPQNTAPDHSSYFRLVDDDLDSVLNQPLTPTEDTPEMRAQRRQQLEEQLREVQNRQQVSSQKLVQVELDLQEVQRKSKFEKQLEEVQKRQEMRRQKLDQLEQDLQVCKKKHQLQREQFDLEVLERQPLLTPANFNASKCNTSTVDEKKIAKRFGTFHLPFLKRKSSESSKQKQVLAKDTSSTVLAKDTSSTVLAKDTSSTVLAKDTSSTVLAKDTSSTVRLSKDIASTSFGNPFAEDMSDDEDKLANGNPFGDDYDDNDKLANGNPFGDDFENETA
jgi:hypothetical protein